MIGVGTQPKETLNKVRLDIRNIDEYLAERYMPGATVTTYEQNRLNMRALLQNDYGAEKDCSLTSITTLIDYHIRHGREIQEIYDKVEAIAKTHKYNGETYGTASLTIKKILGEAYTSFGITKPAKEKLFKNLGYDYTFIKTRIDTNTPLILTMWNDGRDYYVNHSVTVIGYRTFLLEKDGKRLLRPTLMVYDNWFRTTGYLDFTRLGVISSINY